MRSFNSFIFDPEEVGAKLHEVTPVNTRAIKEIDEQDQLEDIIELELQFMREYQPRLYLTATMLAEYLRAQTQDEAPDDEDRMESLGRMDEYVHYGFALGNMACRPNFKLYDRPMPITSLYKDISRESMMLFCRLQQNDKRKRPFGRDDIEITMLLDAIDANTEEKTQRLRETVDWWIGLDGPTARLDQAMTLGAVVAYSLTSHDRLKSIYEYDVEMAHKQYEEGVRPYPGRIVSIDEAYAQHRAAEASFDAAPGSVRQMLSWREYPPRPTARPQKP